MSLIKLSIILLLTSLFVTIFATFSVKQVASNCDIDSGFYFFNNKISADNRPFIKKLPYHSDCGLVSFGVPFGGLVVPSFTLSQKINILIFDNPNNSFLENFLFYLSVIIICRFIFIVIYKFVNKKNKKIILNRFEFIFLILALVIFSYLILEIYKIYNK